MNILILGATGFIGSQLALRLAREGHGVSGLGRSVSRAAKRLPQIRWISTDLAGLKSADDWLEILKAQDIVINCAGALQDGLRDDLAAVQTRSQLALYEAAKMQNLRLVVQISAETDGAAANTAFLKTKRLADEALAQSGLPFVILRPSLVIGHSAYGGTALLRGLAAFPYILPLVHADARVDAVTLEDVAKAVSLAISGEIPPGSDISLASSDTMALGDLVALHRQWLGLSKAPLIRLPSPVSKPVSLLADFLGLLGWRSPLRSTALNVMQGGVAARKAQSPLPFVPQTISAWMKNHPAGVEHLWFARLFLLKPLIFAILSLFWIVSGLVPLLDPSLAASRLEPMFGTTTAFALTFATCALDVILGLALLYRPGAKLALFGMLLTAAAYICGSLIIEPAIWLDPTGPMVKTIPAIILSLVALAILDER